MKKHISILSIAAILSAPVIAQQSTTTGTTGSTAQSTDTRGVPGVEMNVGRNASDRGVPGVEANIGRDGDQRNIDTRALGAGTDTNADGSMRPLRRDRN